MPDECRGDRPVALHPRTHAAIQNYGFTNLSTKRSS
jgi:hypothetical protein